MRLKPVYLNRLKHDAAMLGYAYIGLFAGIWVLPMLLGLLISGSHGINFRNFLASTSIQTLMPIFFFCVGGLVYGGFELFIQNGISRRTYWTGKLLSLSSIALLVSVINILYRLFIGQPAGLKTYQTFGRSQFGNLIHHGWTDVVWFWGRDLSWLILALSIGMMVGAVLGLLTRRWKLITFIALPFAGVGMIWFLFSSSGGASQSFSGSWLFSLIRVMYGVDGQGQYQYPLNLIVTNIVLSGICLAISFWFNRLLRLRRI